MDLPSDFTKAEIDQDIGYAIEQGSLEVGDAEEMTYEEKYKWLLNNWYARDIDPYQKGDYLKKKFNWGWRSFKVTKEEKSEIDFAEFLRLPRKKLGKGRKKLCGTL